MYGKSVWKCTIPFPSVQPVNVAVHGSPSGGVGAVTISLLSPHTAWMLVAEAGGTGNATYANADGAAIIKLVPVSVAAAMPPARRVTRILSPCRSISDSGARPINRIAVHQHSFAEALEMVGHTSMLAG